MILACSAFLALCPQLLNASAPSASPDPFHTIRRDRPSFSPLANLTQRIFGHERSRCCTGRPGEQKSECPRQRPSLEGKVTQAVGPIKDPRDTWKQVYQGLMLWHVKESLRAYFRDPNAYLDWTQDEPGSMMNVCNHWARPGRYTLCTPLKDYLPMKRQHRSPLGSLYGLAALISYPTFYQIFDQLKLKRPGTWSVCSLMLSTIKPLCIKPQN